MRRIDIEPIVLKAKKNQDGITIFLGELGSYKDLKEVDDILFREDLLIIKQGDVTTIYSVKDIICIEVHENEDKISEG